MNLYHAALRAGLSDADMKALEIGNPHEYSYNDSPEYDSREFDAAFAHLERPEAAYLPVQTA